MPLKLVPHNSPSRQTLKFAPQESRPSTSLIIPAPVQEKDNGLNWKVIRETLEELIDFSKPKIDNEIVDKFISRITPLGNNRFAWFVNVSGASTEEIDMMIEGRKNHATIRIDDEKDDETSEDDESSVHNCGNNHGKCSFFEKKYSREWLLHRLQSLINNRFCL